MYGMLVVVQLITIQNLRAHTSGILKECLNFCIVRHTYKDINNYQTDILCNVHMLKCILSILCAHVQV